MAPEAPHSDPLQLAYQATAEEERRLWRAFHDPSLKAGERLVAYARWGAAVKRLNELTLQLAPPGADRES